MSKNGKVSAKDKKDHAITVFILLALVMLVAYLPLSSFYFGMKNDAFSDNFPNKFFISQAIHAGKSPLWNPYMNYGFPVYADMGFAFWNPITWLFAIVGYSAYTLTLEVLLYLFIAGCSMYLLAKYLGFSRQLSFALACMYMCSGFFTGSVQYINFITAAAFIPAAWLCLLRLIHTPCMRHAFTLSLAWYMILAGGHPAIPIAFAYCTLVFTVVLLVSNKSYRERMRQILLYLLVATGLLLLFYLPALYSYVHVLPYYARNHIEFQESQVNTGFTVASWISFLSPFFTAVQNEIFSTDVAMRNAYFSLAGMMGLLLAFRNRNTYTAALLAVAIFALLISAGGDVKAALFNSVPLLSYIRTNGEFRIFIIFPCVLLAGYGLKALFTGSERAGKQYRWQLRLVAAFALTTALAVIFIKDTNLLKDGRNLADAVSFAAKVKAILSGNASTFAAISASLTFIVAMLSLYANSRKSRNFFIGMIIIDLVIHAISYLPVTGVGQTSLRAIQAVYNASPEGIPVPPSERVKDIPMPDSLVTGLTGDNSYYNKKIGTTHLTDYPSYFVATDTFFHSAVKEAVFEKSYLFYKSRLYKADTGMLQVHNFSPVHWDITADAATADTVVLLQNNYKYWKAYVNRHPVPVVNMFGCFMGVPVTSGKNEIEWVYSDPLLYVMIAVAIVGFLICLVFYNKRWKVAD